MSIIVAADKEFSGMGDPYQEALHYLLGITSDLADLPVTMKVNEVGKVIGARSISIIHDTGLGCFLDFKHFDIGETIKNAGSWIRHYKPKYMTVSERIKPDAFRQLQEMLPDTLVLPVGPLTDLDNEDFRHFGEVDRDDAVLHFFERIEKLGARGTICSPKDIRLMPESLREKLTIVTPAVKPVWAEKDNNSINALTPAKAREAGADAIVVGRAITKANNRREAAVLTIAEWDAA